MTTEVTTQTNGKGRWAYVIRFPGEWPYVSDHRYGSVDAARRAGERDLAAVRTVDYR